MLWLEMRCPRSLTVAVPVAVPVTVTVATAMAVGAAALLKDLLAPIEHVKQHLVALAACCRVAVCANST